MQRDISSPLDMTKRALADRRLLWIVGALTIALFLVTNLPWQLDDYDQAKQAYTSFEMVKEGHWFYQQTPRHERVATKPPLVGWMSAGLFAITRSWKIAWRLPSFLAAAALSIVLFRAATSAYGSIAGLLALSAFGFNLLTPRLATLVRTEMPLALIVFLIGLLIWQKIRKREPWSAYDQVSMFALLTAAMLIKGPIVYAFLLPGIAFFQWRGRARPPGAPARHDANPWYGWWPWFASLSVFVAWVIGGIFFQPGFYEQVVMREFLGRFGETIHRPQPLYFYLPHLLHKFAPWSVLIIGIAIVELRSFKWKLREAFQRMSPETWWLICWSVGGLVAMSLIPSKRVDRIFPVIPPLCLLLAAQVANALRDETNRRRTYRWSGIALALSILFTTAHTSWKIRAGYRDHRDALDVFGRDVRREAEKNHWRFEVVSARDEGLLLYLRKLHFTKPERAVAEWNAGKLDALVVSQKDAPSLMRDLRGAVLSQLKSQPRKDERGDYVLLTHEARETHE